MTDIPRTTINDLPKKELKTLLGFLSQNERQLARAVCPLWNRFINEEFPIELSINGNNFERLFSCCNANKATITSLISEFHGEIAFKGSLKTLVIAGKVLSSNIIRILSVCHELEYLLINSPKEVLGIENHEVFGLPNLTILEFRVRVDQETFTSDEMILLTILGNMKLGSLQKVIISVKFDWDDLEDEESDDRGDVITVDQSGRFVDSLSTMSGNMSDGSRYPYPAVYPSVELQSSNGTFTDVVPSDRSTFLNQPLPLLSGSTIDIDLGAFVNIAPEPSEQETTSVDQTERPAQVDVSVGMTVTEASASRSRETTYSRVGVAEFEFASRLFADRLQMRGRNSFVDLDTFLNDPITRAHFGFKFPGNRLTANANLFNMGIKTTAFFELLKNNSDNLKSFVVKARPDFLGFGNISAFSKADMKKIQLEEIEYSFGRSSRLCSEHLLLEQQGHLISLKLHILDDMWQSVTTAAEKSQSTLTELDVKILSLSEDPLNLLVLSKCKSLKILKIFHFFAKEYIELLPSSLVKLVMNGPVTKEDLGSIANRLENLVQFDLILNYQPSEKIDLPLFRRLTAMPKIRKLVFIQTQIDVDAISEFCRNTPGLVANIQGPNELREPFTLTSIIQYVCISVNPVLPPTSS